jgi:hypothetical protein
MPKMLINTEDLHIINHVLCWKPPKGVDRGVGIQNEPACVVVVMTCKTEKIAVNLWTWEGEESLELLYDTAIALRAVARDVEKARSIKGDQFDCPVIDTTKMGQG